MKSHSQKRFGEEKEALVDPPIPDSKTQWLRLVMETTWEFDGSGCPSVGQDRRKVPSETEYY